MVSSVTQSKVTQIQRDVTYNIVEVLHDTGGACTHALLNTLPYRYDTPHGSAELGVLRTGARIAYTSENATLPGTIKRCTDFRTNAGP